MKKSFDIPGEKKSSFFRNLKINPNFPFQKREILRFLLFLFLIGFLSIFLSYVFYPSSFLRNFFPRSIINAVNGVESVLDFENKIVLLEDALSNIEKENDMLKDYSLKSEVSEKLLLLKTQLEIIRLSLTDLYDAKDMILQNKDFSGLIAYLHLMEENYQRTFNLLNYFLDPRKLNYFPEVISDKFRSTAQLIESLPLKNQDFNDLYYLLGDSQPLNYLIWFQNKAESRATGGFIGSYARFVMNNGRINEFKIEDIYLLDDSYHEPAPLLASSLVPESSLSLRDTNYSPDFVKSAEVFNSFYQKSGGDSIDVLIAIDNELVEEFFQDVHSLYLEDYSYNLDVNWLSFAISYFTEGKISATNPKSSISKVFLPAIIQAWKQLSDEAILKKLLFLKDNIKVYVYNDLYQGLIIKLGLLPNFQDQLSKLRQIPYFRVSVSGNKSDAFLEEEIKIASANHSHNISMKIKHNWNNLVELKFQEFKEYFPKSIIDDEYLKKLLGEGSSHGLYYFYLPIDSKNISVENALSYKSWAEDSRLILELETPYIESGEEKKITVDFESNQDSYSLLRLN